MTSEKFFSDSFFNLPHPSSPNVSIQFRANLNKDENIDNPSQWREITINPSNFFDSFTLEDTGGAYELSLNLYDKNYSFLEDTVVQTLFNTKLANKLESSVQGQDTAEYFAFFVSKASNANLRIRFGYSDVNIGGNNQYISETKKTNANWLNRTENLDKTVLQTPWIYFQIIDTDFKVTGKGLQLSLKAFSLTESFLSKAHLIESYANLSGPPEDVIKLICNRIKAVFKVNNETFEFVFEDKPQGYPSLEPPNEEIIEVMLGGVNSFTRDYRTITRYKNLKRLLREACDAVRPKRFDIEGNLITNDFDEEFTHRISRYSYYITETEEKTKITFYYQKAASESEQPEIRMYTWLQEGNSIVKDLELLTAADFATLSLPIVNISDDKETITARKLNPSGEEEKDFYNLGSVSETNIFNNIDFNSTFVFRVIDSGSDDYSYSNDVLSDKEIARKITDRIQANLNQQVVTGRMTILGDAFYLFDEKVKPFVYKIGITVKRPNYLDKNGNFVDGGISYLSGFYVITKITHNISRSGFQTELELIKVKSFGN